MFPVNPRQVVEPKRTMCRHPGACKRGVSPQGVNRHHSRETPDNTTFPVGRRVVDELVGNAPPDQRNCT